MAGNVEKYDNAVEENEYPNGNTMFVCESNKNILPIDGYSNDDVPEQHENFNIYLDTELSLSDMNAVKIENEMMICEFKQEIDDYVDNEVPVNEELDPVSDIQLKNNIKYEELELFDECSSTKNFKREFSFELGDNITNDEVKIEDQTIVDNIHIKFENKFQFCDQCSEIYNDYCSKCHMLIYILNGNTITKVDNRTAKDIPNGILEIRESREHCGIYALKRIPEDVRLGPFTGLKNSDCSWRIKGGRFIVGEDKLEFLNWMQFISPAQNVFKHNLIALLYEDHIYYRSTKEILEGEELLVYFGEKYDSSLMDNIEVDFIPTKEAGIEDVFSCTVCCLGFNSLEHLSKHKTICPNDTADNSLNRDIMQCPHCKIYFEQWEYEEHHMTSCRDDDAQQYILSIPDDLVMASNSRSGQDHKLYKKYLNGNTGGHNNIKGHTCTICFKRFRRKESLQLHTTKVHIVDERRRCYLCESKMNGKSHFKAHMRSSHFKDGKYNCTKCTYETKLEGSLEKHFNIHETVKRFECSKCDYVTHRQINLKTHYSTHESTKRYKCSKCDYVTNRQGNLKTHHYTHDTMKRLKCSKCDYVTNRKSNLNSHVGTHDTVKRFECSKCDYATNLRGSLQKHLFTHETIKHLKCSQCDYTTNRTDNLKKHADSHGTAAKKFKCSQCDYATNRKNNLKTHSYTHENVKRFQCPKCDFATSLKRNLKKHFGIHETVKRFKCTQCDYATNCKDYLKNHSYIHEMVKRFKCAKCDYATNQKHHLKRHFNKHSRVSSK